MLVRCWCVLDAATHGCTRLMPPSPAGPVSVTVAGVQAVNAPTYDFQVLIRPPSVLSVSPTTGPAMGGTVVTVVGSGFGSNGTVWLVERDAGLSLTGSRSECVWRNVPDLGSNDAVIR